MYVSYNLFSLHLDGVVTQYPVARIPASDIVDTNGAGDAFIGGENTYKRKITFFYI